MIQVTDERGVTQWLNPSHIIRLVEDDDDFKGSSGALVIMTDEILRVEESARQIKEWIVVDQRMRIHPDARITIDIAEA